MGNQKKRNDEAPIEMVVGEVRQALGSTPRGDHVVNVIKGLFAAVPIVGGTISSLMGDYIPRRKEQRLIRFTEALAKDLDKIQDRIDTDYITTDEFAHLFLKTYRAVEEQYQEEKLEILRAFLVNSLLDRETSADEKEFFLRVANDLTVLEAKLLRLFSDPEGTNVALGNPIKPAMMTTSLMSLIRRAFPDMSEDMITAAVSSLDGRGILGGVAEALKPMMAAGGVEHLGGRLAPFGTKFVQFVTMPD
ncbi:MAG: hypothetical protein KAW17_13430 [Candidatus Eisenbacteria sp.]|nr:hypothetical protein [Candidatus Eisenbacteria bacterium]